MNLNATIFGQILTFVIFIWINKSFIWPKILHVLQERETKIAQGLQAAELGKQKLHEVELIAKQQEIATKKHCNLLINEAKKQAEQILELFILKAKNKEQEIMEQANLAIAQERMKLKKDLQQNLAQLILKSTEKIIANNLSKELHYKILTDIGNNIYDKK